MKQLLAFVFALCLGLCPASADEIYTTFRVDLSGDHTSMERFSIIIGSEQVFYTNFYFDPSVGSAATTRATRGFFLPASGGSKCYEGPRLDDQQTTMCVTISVSGSSIRFEVQQETHRSDLVWKTDYAGTIRLSGNDCTISVRSYKNRPYVDGNDLGVRRLVRVANTSCHIFEGSVPF